MPLGTRKIFIPLNKREELEGLIISGTLAELSTFRFFLSSGLLVAINVRARFM
jgi:hypothetical protein